ncbi:hypothetical protein [Clostridium kluyveri]|nr:hypothetical protein [Clostridium kluyveri]
MGVLYGYGDRDELEKAGTDFIVNLVVDKVYYKVSSESSY